MIRIANSSDHKLVQCFNQRNQIVVTSCFSTAATIRSPRLKFRFYSNSKSGLPKSRYSTNTNSLRQLDILKRQTFATFASQSLHSHLLLETLFTGRIIPQNDNQSEDQIVPANNIVACSPDKNDTIVKRVLSRLKKTSRFLYNMFLLLFRGAQIGFQLSPMLILSPLAILESRLLISGQEGKLTKDDNWVEGVTWKYFLQTLHSLGPAFVKLAQWAATRRDLFPAYYCDHLSLLHDRAPPHSWESTHRTLLSSFGPDYSQKLRINASSEIIGSGAAAQVYKAYLKGYGLVAVKVLHPNISERVHRDWVLMNTAATFLDSILPSDLGMCLSLPRAVETFGNALNKQVDLTIEAENLHQFRRNFGLLPRQNSSLSTDRDQSKNSVSSNSSEIHQKVDFPCPIPEWTTPNVLVENLISNSEPISHYLTDPSEDGKQLRKKLTDPFLRAFMKMVFVDNFIHCDLHPGNVLIQTSTSKCDRNLEETNHSIVFLDAGISTALSKNDLQNLKDLFQAVVFNNGEEVGRLMVERARYERCSQIPGGIDSFSKGMAELVQEFHDAKGGVEEFSGDGSTKKSKKLSLGLVHVGSLLKRVLDLCRTHGVEIDPAMSSVVVSILILEGLGRSLDPEADLIEYAIPFLMGYGKL